MAVRAHSSASLAISKICSQDIRVTIRFSDQPRQFRLIGYQLDESRALCRRTNYDGFLGFRVRMIPYLATFFLGHLFRSATAEGNVVVRKLNFHSTNTNDANRLSTTKIYIRFILFAASSDYREKDRQTFLRVFNFDDYILTTRITIRSIFIHKLDISKKYWIIF